MGEDQSNNEGSKFVDYGNANKILDHFLRNHIAYTDELITPEDAIDTFDVALKVVSSDPEMVKTDTYYDGALEKASWVLVDGRMKYYVERGIESGDSSPLDRLFDVIGTKLAEVNSKIVNGRYANGLQDHIIATLVYILTEYSGLTFSISKDEHVMNKIPKSDAVNRLIDVTTQLAKKVGSWTLEGDLYSIAGKLREAQESE